MEEITLHVVPLRDLDLQTPPAGSCWDKIVDNVAKGYYIYGNYEGDVSSEHFLGFGNYNHRIPCTGFGLMLGRRGLPVDAGGNPAPLYIGLTTTDEISGDGIYHPENWSKKGILYPEDLDEPDTWYWIWASFPDAPYPDIFHMVVATTDAYFEEGTENYWLWGAIEGEIDEYPRHADVFHGWDHGGWWPLLDMLCFFTWTECEVPVCTNPSGVENDIICGDPYYGQDPTHKYKCQDGVWVDQGYSADCVEECSPEGSRKCVGTDLYECRGSKWVLIEVNSSECFDIMAFLPWIIVGAGVVTGVVLVAYGLTVKLKPSKA